MSEEVAVQITLKLKIDASPDTVAVLEETARQYAGSFNRVAAAGWEMPRLNGVELHKATYRLERARTTLPSQLVCSARVRATESLQSAFTRKKKGLIASCPHSRGGAVRYDARSATVRLATSRATLSSVAGRQVVDLTVPPCFRKYVDARVCSSDLCRVRDGRFFLHVVIEVGTPDFADSGGVVGVDLGMNRPLVTSGGDFLGEVSWKDVNDRYFKLTGSLQAKGTRSARRHLRRLGGRVNRFRTDCDHVLSRGLVDSVEGGTTIVLEDLTGIRKQSRKNRDQRRRLHSWSFSRLRTLIEYKAVLAGCRVAIVDARYTSQKCSVCGHVSKSNRRSQSEFACKSCGWTVDADLNAAVNIRRNYLDSRAVVNQPIAPGLVRSSKPPASAGGS